MKAYVLHQVNQLRYDEVPEPACPAGWALVRVKAAGICSSDIARIFTKGTYHFPTIPGHEFSGVVERVGRPEDRHWIGKPAGIFPLIPCKTCGQCRKGRYELCEHYDYVGSRRDGGFAELAAVPVWNLVALDAGISYEEAAMLEPLAVALHAMKRGGIQPGDTVGIIGTGMIGLAAAQWAKRFGASRIGVVGRSEEKRALVQELEGVEYLVEGKQDLPLFDVTLEAVGTPAAVETAIRQTRPEGCIVLMGNPSGDMDLAQDTYWRILRKQIRLTGTWNSAYNGAAPSDWTEVCEALSKGEVSARPLISHRVPQESLQAGLELMRDHKEPYCKVMSLWNASNEPV